MFPVEDTVQRRMGRWRNGKRIEWLTIPINRIQTETFIEEFLDHPENLTGPHAMEIARLLPKLPPGIDPNNEQVQHIARQIMTKVAEMNADSLKVKMNA